MLPFRLTISTPLCKDLDLALRAAQRRGDIRLVKRILAIFALRDSFSPEQVASLFKVSPDTILDWAKNFLCYKLNGLKDKKSPGNLQNLLPRKSASLSLSWMPVPLPVVSPRLVGVRL